MVVKLLRRTVTNLTVQFLILKKEEERKEKRENIMFLENIEGYLDE